VPAGIEVVTVIDAPVSVVFDLELDVDLHAASLSRSRETATTNTGRRHLSLGDEATFDARHLGLRWRMTSRITAYDRPHRFIDEQTRGPFRTLHHEHVFLDLGNGRTRMIDRMRITAPGGAAGSVVARTLLVLYLRRLLRQRAAHIKYAAEAATRAT
jgi:ligand-binding SRPBCC domain-containing protein